MRIACTQKLIGIKLSGICGQSQKFFIFLRFWNENCLTSQKLLRYQIVLDMSKSISDLFITLSSFNLSLSGKTTQNVNSYQNPNKTTKKLMIKWTQLKNAQKDGQTCWMNFVNFEAAKKIRSEQSVGCAANDEGEYVTLSRRFSSRFIFL